MPQTTGRSSEAVLTGDAPAKKRPYHHGDLRNAIISEATSRARAHGQQAIVLREIAAQIGVSATAAYRHFTNRQQLVEEVAVRGVVAVGEDIRSSGVDGADSDPGLASYVDLRNACFAAVEFAANEPGWSRMMYETVWISTTVAQASAVNESRLQEIVDRGIDAGMFLPGTEIGGNRVFWAGVNGLCARAMFETDPADPAETDRVIARVVDLCATDMLTDVGRAARDAAALPDGRIDALAEIPR